MRLVFRIVSALVITVALLVTVLLLLPGEKGAAWAADQIEAQTGRKLTFQGEVRFTLWPILGVNSDGVTLSNADWAGPEPMLTAQRLSIGISGSDLLLGKVRVTEISAWLPHLNLSERADGLGNWVLGSGETAVSAPAAEAENQTAALPISIEKLSLTGASLRYQPQEGAPVEMSSVDLELQWPDPSGTVNMDLTLRPAGEPLHVVAEVGTFAAFLSGDVASVGATVNAEGGFLRFDGRADLTGAATGRVTAKTTNTSAFLAALGQAGIILPRGLGQAMSIGADATYTTDGRLALRDMALDLDGNHLEGAADIAFSEVPQFTAQLNGGHLKIPGLTDASASAEATGTGGAASSGWSKEPIDASGLALANGTAVLSFQSLTAAGYQFGASKLSVTLDRARGVLKLQPAALFGGEVHGQLVANNRNGFSVGGKLTYNDIRLEKALGEVAGYERLNGSALGELEYLASGNSLDALMRTLSGKGWVEISKGFFSGFDLEELMRSGQGNGGSTVFDQLTGSYTLSKGNLQNDDLLITLKGLRAEGAGRIGLAAQDLDYLFTPTISGVNGAAGLSIPVAITGSWSKPKIRPDLQGALQPQIDAAEQEAKDRLRQKLEEELETEIAPEQDLNEVIRDRIEQEAKDQLLRLLKRD
ncbi:AsmA family protein [Pseudophaeobacter leonis]|uniref:AsmA family protein n=1 Tax=Pseudophaeobacter leonis TaxID=1144477 RepID=UPI0009F70AE7|nr:AsmA family protein [Pseudophaeobacter leonis]